MARRDVELVIRAKNEASRAVDSISTALKTLIGTQTDLVQSSRGVDNTLTRLRSAFNGLNQAFKGTDAAGAIATQLEKARSAVDRLETETREAAASAIEMAADSNRAADSTQALAGAAERASASLKEEKAALAGLSAEQAELNAAMRRATADRTRLAASDEKLTRQMASQSVNVDKAAARYGELASRMAAAVSPSKTLSNQMAAANANLEKQEAKLVDLADKYERNRASMSANAETMARLQSRLAATNASFDTQVAALNRAEAEYTNLGASMKVAQQNQNELAQSSERMAAALRSSEQALARGREELKALEGTATEAAAAMARIAATAGDTLVAAMARQRRAMLEAKREWSEAEASVRSLAQALRAADAPTTEMVDDFERARASAAKAKAEYLEQRTALHQMGQAYRDTGQDIASMEATTARFQGILDRLSSRQTEVAATARQAGQAQRALGGATAETGQRVSFLQRVLASLGIASRSASDGTASLTRNILGIGNASRTAMTYTQRLRAEVLSLIAAYGGIFGAVQGIRNVIEATQTLQQAQNRLGVIFEGDEGKAAAELDFIRRSADRLGIAFGELSKQYTIFASSTLGTNIAGEKTREIFVAVAEAARVNNSSMEDVQAVFKALGQIASKGTVQMEELRGQLGDRMPGALKLMADGLGITVAELADMTKQGEITSDALLGFAEQLQKRYGPELGRSLTMTTALLGKLGNAGNQALLKIGRSGFIESFNNFLTELTDFVESDTGSAIFESIGKGLAFLTDAFAFVIENARAFLTVMAAITGLNISRVLIFITRAFGGLSLATRTASMDMSRLSTTTKSAAVSAGVASGAFTRMAASIRAIGLSSLVGVAITAITTGLALWITRADKATTAMTTHREIVDSVKNAYDSVADASDSWVQKLEGASMIGLSAAMAETETAISEARQELLDFIDTTVFPGGFGATALDPFREDVAQMIRDLVDGETSVLTFRQQIDQLFQNLPEDSPLRVVLQDLDKLVSSEGGVEELTAALGRYKVIQDNAGKSAKEMRAALEAYDRSIKGLVDDTDEAAKAQDKLAEALQKAEEAMGDTERIVDELKDAYGESGEAAEEWLKRLRGGVTLQQVINNMKQLEAGLEAAKQQLFEFAEVTPDEFVAMEFNVNSQPAIDSVKKLGEAWRAGIIDSEQFKNALSDLGLASNDPKFQDFVLTIQSMVDKMTGEDGLITATEDVQLALTALTGTAEEQAIAMEALKLGVPYEEAKQKIKEARLEALKLGDDASDSANKIVTRVDHMGRAWTRVGNLIRRATKDEADAARDLNEALKTPGQTVTHVGESFVKTGNVITRAVGETGNVVVEMDEGIKRATTSADALAASLGGITGAANLSSLIDNARLAADALTNTRDTATAFFEVLGQAAPAAQAAWEQIVTSSQGSVNVLQQSFQALETYLTNFWTAVETRASNALQAVQAIAGINVDFIAIGDAAEATFARIVTALTEAAPQITTGFSGITTTISKSLETLTSSAATSLENFGKSIITVMRSVSNQVRSIFRSLVTDVKALISSLSAELRRLREAINAAKQASSGNGAPGKAGGGRIFGRGTGTSDTAGVFRLSRDEFVLRAAAARHYGYTMLQAMNNLRFPKRFLRGMALGGPVGAPSGGGLDFGPIMSALSAATRPMRPLLLQMADGTQFPVMAPEDTAASLVRYVRQRKVASGGRKPSWYGA